MLPQLELEENAADLSQKMVSDRRNQRRVKNTEMMFYVFNLSYFLTAACIILINRKWKGQCSLMLAGNGEIRLDCTVRMEMLLPLNLVQLTETVSVETD